MRTEVPFSIGVRRSLNYVLSHPECQREDPDFDAYCDKVITAIEEAKKQV
jgi:hypothetical protein